MEIPNIPRFQLLKSKFQTFSISLQGFSTQVLIKVATNHSKTFQTLFSKISYWGRTQQMDLDNVWYHPLITETTDQLRYFCLSKSQFVNKFVSAFVSNSVLRPYFGHVSSYTVLGPFFFLLLLFFEYENDNWYYARIFCLSQITIYSW